MDNMGAAVIELAEKHLGKYKIKNGQVVAEYCPICHGNNHDRETFAVGLSNGLWQCLRGSCGKKGNFTQLCNMFGETSDTASYYLPKATKQEKKTYTKPDPENIKDLTPEIIKYFKARKISEQTLRDWHVGSDKDGNIVFTFYRDGVLTFVKHRKPKKHTKEDGPKEWPDANTEPILYGMDMTTFNKPLVITEGEIDALALYESGVSNVVSVPMGCNNFDWINLCWDYIEKFNQIILFGDSDEPGREMVATLATRLGEDRCMIPQEYPEYVVTSTNESHVCKDANEILYYYGPEYLKKMVDECEPAPIKGVIDVGDIVYIDPISRPRIMTKIPALDKMTGGLQEGGVSILSGKSGEGKSTLSGLFLLNAIEDGQKACAYSGELDEVIFLDWLLTQATERKYIGYKTDERTKKNMPCVSEDIRKRIQKWIKGNLFLFDNKIVGEQEQTKAILGVFEACARRYGCKIFLVDNLMSALTSPEEENRAQAKFTAQLKAFARKYHCHVIMVAHPRKSNGKKEFENEDISGSSAIGNLADFVINVERYPTRGIRLTKNRIFGEKGFINCDYDPATRRLYQHNLGGNQYSWDHSGIQTPEHPAQDLDEFKIDNGEEVQAQPF
jgi:twinkle protein